MPEEPQAQTPAPETPMAPEQPAPSIVSPIQPTVVASGKSSKNSKKLVLFTGIAVAALLVIGGGYVFGYYIPSMPENVYGDALVNTGRGIDKLVAYSKQQEQTNYKSMDFDGSVNVKSPSVSFDMTLNGSADASANAMIALQADVMGEKATANIRTIHVSGSTNPDVYVQVNGIKTLLDANGMGSIDALDGQWVSVDHTLLDTYTRSITQELRATSKDTSGSTGLAPSYTQLQDAIAKVQDVNKQYLFTTDASKAVLANQTFIAKETQSGKAMNHYKVGYNKAHLQAYVAALKSAVDSSTLNDWSRQAYDGKSLSDVLDVQSLKDSVKNAKNDYTFDLWVNLDTKLVSKVAFTDPSDSASVFTLSQDYDGSSKYPFTLSLGGKDASGNPENGSFGMVLDTTTNKATVTVAVTTADNTGTSNVNATLNTTPSNKSVVVAAPTGSRSIIDILNSLGLGSLSSDSGLTGL